MSSNSAPPPTGPVSVIGLGNMGTSIAQIFIKGGYQVTMWNRTASKADALVAQGGVLAKTPSEAVAASPVTVVCLTSDASVQETLGTVASFTGHTIINLTNGTPNYVRNISKLLLERGATTYLHGAIMVPPPLLGLPTAVTLYAGPKAAFDEHAAILTALGAPKHVSPEPAMATLYDNALLSIMGGLFGGFVQSLGLIRGAGLDEVAFSSDLAVPLLTAFAGWLPRIAAQVKSKEYVQEGGSTLEMQLEALDNIEITGRDLGLSRSLLDGLKEMIKEAISKGRGKESIAGLVDMLS